MNSPQDSESSSPSTPSSGSPPLDTFIDAAGFILPPVGLQLPSPTHTKRRLAPSASSTSRDIKSRKREEVQGKKGFGMAAATAPEFSGREKKDEFVDVDFMEALKEELGDPFDDAFPEGTAV